MMHRIIFFFVLQLFAAATVQAQSLADHLSAGRIEILEMSGNGSSSGAALEGELRNTSSSTIRVDVNLLEPIYFHNLGRAQNMIATQIYEEGGGYYVVDNRSFIEIPPRSDIDVLLIAYCADFELDNPGIQSRFVVGELPPDLANASRRIAAYEAAHPNEDTTAASQVALWLSQGLSPSEIATQFTFSQADLSLARTMLR